MLIREFVHCMYPTKDILIVFFGSIELLINENKERKRECGEGLEITDKGVRRSGQDIDK